jgi:transcriptional regulator
VTDAPADFVEKMVAAVVGIEISITQLVGKWKVNQNRSISDRVGVIEALEREATPSGAAIAALIRETLEAAIE